LPRLSRWRCLRLDIADESNLSSGGDAKAGARQDIRIPSPGFTP
jgi:hypothetical protein